MKISDLIQSRFNCRKEYPSETISELQESIEKDGLFSRLVLREKGGKHEVLAGWRRRLALGMIFGEDAELSSEYFVVKQVSDFDAVRLSIAENVYRINLSAIEMAEAVASLISEKPGIKAKEIAKYLWTTEARVKRLMELPKHLNDLPANAIQNLSMPDEMEPAFTDAHLDALVKSGAFELDSYKVKDLVDSIIDQELPASRISAMVDKMAEKNHDPSTSDPEGSSSTQESNTPEDSSMVDTFKGLLVLDGDNILVKTKKETLPVDLSYYRNFLENPDKFRVWVQAKIKIETL